MEKAFTEVINDLKKENQQLTSEIDKVKDNNTQLQNSMVNLKTKYEQDMKRNNIIIHGVPEETNENTETVVNNLIEQKLKSVVYPLKKCYRITSRFNYNKEKNNENNAKPRPIRIEFESSEGRRLTIIRRKLLKNSGISIREDLSQHVLKMLKECKIKYGTSNTWTIGGHLRVKHNNVIYKIEKEEDFP